MASYYGVPRVRALRPAVWSACTVSVLYFVCAAYEVHHDYRLARRQRQMLGDTQPSRPLPARDLEFVRANVYVSPYANPWTEVNTERRTAQALRVPVSQLRFDSAYQDAAAVDRAMDSMRPPYQQLEYQVSLVETEKVAFGLIGANLGVFHLERLVPALQVLFSHVPAHNVNATLLTSTFGHTGVLHLAANMYGVYQFLRPVAYSPTFAGSGSHLTAFFLSTGITSSLAHHLGTIWPRPIDRVLPSRGASGALMAVLGLYGMAYPTNELGLLFIPGSLPAQQVLGLVTAFEAYGFFVGYSWLNFAHGAHLGGLAAGAAYVHFGLGQYLWTPAKRAARTTLNFVGLIDVADQ